MPRVAVTAIGADRPGIVAGVTGALADLGANLEDTSMSVLSGRFAMVLLVDVPAGVDDTAVRASMAPLARSLHLDIDVHAVEEPALSPVGGDRWSVTVYGADRPGIVHRVTTLLAERDANIVDLTTRVVGRPPVYAMLLEVDLPPGVDGSACAAALDTLGVELGVECDMHPADADIL